MNVYGRKCGVFCLQFCRRSETGKIYPSDISLKISKLHGFAYEGVAHFHPPVPTFLPKTPILQELSSIQEIHYQLFISFCRMKDGGLTLAVFQLYNRLEAGIHDFSVYKII